MEGEGIYLSRAAAYIQECMNRRSLVCDAFVPRTRKASLDKTMDSDAKQDSRDAISKNASRLASRLPCTKVALTPLVPEPDSDLPSALVSPASPNDGEQHAVQVIDQENEASMKRSPGAKHESVPSVKMPQGLLVESANAGHLNEQPTSCERPARPVPTKPEYSPDLPSMGKQELPIGAANVECSEERPSYREAPALPVPVDPDLPDAASAIQPSQEAVSNIEASVLIHS